MHVAEAIAPDQNSINYIDMSYECSVHRVERLRQELVKLEATGD